MTWVDFDINKLIKLLLPTFLRRINMILFLEAILYPLQGLKREIMYKMQHDCRVIYIEKVLNEHFNILSYNTENHFDTKIIYITNGDDPDEVYLNTNNHPDPIYLGEQFINSDEYYDQNYADFIVNVPMIYFPREREIKSLVNYYKMAGKAYKIQYF